MNYQNSSLVTLFCRVRRIQQLNKASSGRVFAPRRQTSQVVNQRIAQLTATLQPGDAPAYFPA